jgi:hypothetical protein
MQIGGANAIAHSVKSGTMDTAPIPGVDDLRLMTKRRSRDPSLASAFSFATAFAPIAGIET